MMSVVGEEFLAYSESSTGHYTPLVAVAKYDGSTNFRDVIKEDLTRINDTEVLPGSWIFRKTLGSAGSWVKRFAILRGAYIFLFHSPQNEKPIAIIPLDGCKIVVPENNDKTFEEARVYKANDGYEFDIRHNLRPTARLYALSALERNEWVQSCKQRCSFISLDMSSSEHIAKLLPPGGNIMLTNTKLSGLSLANNHNHNGGAAANNTNNLPSSSAQYANPHIPPRMSEYEPSEVNSVLSFSTSYTAATGPRGGAVAMPPPPPHMTTIISEQSSVYSSPPPPPPPMMSHAAVANNQQFPPPPPTAPYASSQQSVASNHSQRSNNSSVNKLNKQLLETHFSALESSLVKMVDEQKEAKDREEQVRSQISSREVQQEARRLEEQNPLTLAELFRLMLFFVEEELAEDPQVNSKQQFPHVKGHAIEEMLMTCYQRYCNDAGFMTLEKFVEFMEDSAILQTHAPHDDNDEPLDEFKESLNPVTLLRALPRQNTNTSIVNQVNSLTIEEMMKPYAFFTSNISTQKKNDKFLVDFGQFYQILLRISQIVYSELYARDPTVAFNKILQETICPLYLWCKGHHKRGSSDELVLEERILLVMSTYAPNLWKVFLTYAADAVGKVPEISLAFPDTAQLNEKGMFKLPPVAPTRFYTDATNSSKTTTASMESLFMSETACLRFARDYGITPYLLTQAQLREWYRTTNRQKIIVSSRLPVRDQISSRAPSMAKSELAAKKREPLMHFGHKHNHNKKASANTGKAANSNNADDTSQASVPMAPPAVGSVGGLSFSEFVEFIARIAVDGMKQPNYHIIFPTPFSKVLAILTVWGVADLKKLEEVRIIRTEEAY